jgi:hypothetical protein
MSVCRTLIAHRHPRDRVAGGPRALSGVALPLVLAVGLGLAGCAHRPAVAPAAPQTPEVYFSRSSPTAVAALIAEQCRAVGWLVDHAEAASVTCTGTLTTPQRILDTLTLRNASRQTQRVSYHFIVAEQGREVGVQSECWFSDSDRGRRRELSRTQTVKVRRQMTGFLVLMGGHL